MSDLRDSKLTAAQLNVLVELNSTGKLPRGVRPRTIEILREGKFIDVTRVGEEDPTYVLRTEGKREIGIEDSFHETLMADVAELEEGLKGDPWKMGEHITADEPYLEFKDEPIADWERELLASPGLVIRDSDGELKDSEGTEFDKFNSKWSPEVKRAAGFGETLNWNKTKVWDGLTATEIRDDIDTARLVNRKARRGYAKIEKKAATAVRLALRELAAA